MGDLQDRFVRGDDQAFALVIERYSRKVYALCYRILRDEEEAKDTAQEVFVRVYMKRRSFRSKSSLYTWIYRIALNMCFSHLKKRKAVMVPLDDVENTLTARCPDDTGRQAELEGLVSRALGSLPPKQRAVFSLRFYEKMAFKDIAEAMGTSVGAAKANHHFAVNHLRRILGEAGRD